METPAPPSCAPLSLVPRLSAMPCKAGGISPHTCGVLPARLLLQPPGKAAYGKEGQSLLTWAPTKLQRSPR